ncbi:YkgJ family cysteine cluster protein [uncultured Desulfuromonas sp.]|uniref:YkgJ family cysteine cluster protein n=1 Tax=uncultured Desulfuromonas sp. TaxID=181013 RepID=UPI002AAB7942|nr:YkgJ family cysteine cluster protein [uncultured Desulfuromonas sp.]
MDSFDFISYHRQIRHMVKPYLADFERNSNSKKAMQHLIDRVEDDLERRLTHEDRCRVACQAGCGSCCRVNVAVLRPEAVNIADYLQKTRSAAELRDLKQRMKALRIAISGLDDDERIAVRKNCVFLDESGSCSIYPVRPLLCRSITSTSAADCRDALAMHVFGESKPVMMNLMQKNLMNVAFQGLASAMEDQGLDAHGQELTAAVLAVLVERDVLKELC